MDRRGYNRRKIGASAAVAAPQTPAQIFGGGLAAWYTADLEYLTLDGSGVSGWADRSGGVSHLSQPTSANQMTWNATGWGGTKGSVTSDRGAGTATRKWISADGASLANVADGESPLFGAIFTVRLVSTATLDTLISFGHSASATNVRAWGLHAASTRWGGFERDGTSVNIDTGDASDTLAHTLAFVRKASERIDIYLDGVAIMADGDLSALGALDFDRVTFGAFRRVGVDEGSNAAFREMLVVSGAITPEQITAYHTYAQGAHGL